MCQRTIWPGRAISSQASQAVPTVIHAIAAALPQGYTLPVRQGISPRLSCEIISTVSWSQ
jgi:hypothetical protein